MASNKGTQSVYYIPNNYADETRVFQGTFKLRYLIEGCVMGGTCALVSLLFPIPTLNQRISAFLFMAMPGLLLGITGYNGDPISSAAVYIYKWFNEKQIKLYNPTPRILKSSPSADIIGSSKLSDKLIDVWEEHQRKRLQEKGDFEYIEGETFVFKSDPFVDNYTGSPMTDEEYHAYLEKLKAEKEKASSGDIMIVTKSNMNDLDDIALLDEYDDYLVDKK